MLISTFASYFDRLAQTTSRNTITAVLAELFTHATATEIDKICYLSLGRLAPKFVPLEFQFAKKLMVRAIALSTGQTEAHITTDFKRIGDLGDVVFKLQMTNDKLQIKKQTVTEVYEKLLTIAQEEGAGSVERKIRGFAHLLIDLDPLSAKYIVRIALGIIRLGFSDTTILDALSVMHAKDKSLRKDLEYAYNISADIGLIAATFKEKGEAGIHRMQVHPGIPIRPQQAERLPTAPEIVEKLGECAIEYKLDGLRAQVHVISNVKVQMSNVKFGKKQKQLAIGEKDEGKDIRIFSRNLEDTTHMFPEIVDAARKLSVDSAIFDGEAIGVDPKTGKFLPFQDTSQRKRKHNIAAMAKKVPIKYFAFDILYLNGEHLLGKTFRERREILEKIVRK